VLARARAVGVGAVVAVGSEPASNAAVLRLAREHRDVLPALGCHPERLELTAADVDAVEAQVTEHRPQVVALGEVGLPWYALDGRADAGAVAAVARERLTRLLALARRHELPLSIHAPHDAAADALALLEASGAGPAVFHWHKAELAVTRRIVAAGHFLGVTPEVAWRGRDQAMVRAVPLTALVPESDGPWRYRDRVGEPAMVAEVVTAVAAAVGRPLEDVAAALADNARRWLRPLPSPSLRGRGSR
jgi:TatD DNase family protein